MRVTALLGAFGVAATIALSAQAAPAVPAPDRQQSNIIQVAGGCGPGFHPTPWGRCVPFHHGFRRGWGDDSADFLNREEMRRMGY